MNETVDLRGEGLIMEGEEGKGERQLSQTQFSDPTHCATPRVVLISCLVCSHTLSSCLFVCLTSLSPEVALVETPFKIPLLPAANSHPSSFHPMTLDPAHSATLKLPAVTHVTRVTHHVGTPFNEYSLAASKPASIIIPPNRTPYSVC